MSTLPDDIGAKMTSLLDRIKADPEDWLAWVKLAELAVECATDLEPGIPLGIDWQRAAGGVR